LFFINFGHHGVHPVLPNSIVLFKFKDNDKIVFVMINLDDDEQFLDKEIFITFQAVSAVPKKFIRDHYLLQSF
jgi:hypothetical protein